MGRMFEDAPLLSAFEHRILQILLFAGGLFWVTAFWAKIEKLNVMLS